MTDTTSGTPSSPFDAAPTAGRGRLIRVGLPALIVAASIVATLLMGRDAPEAPATVGHDHGAAGTGSAGATPVVLDTEQARRMGVTFAPVTVGDMPAEIRAVGQLTWDETRTAAIAPRVDGWIERLHVNFTGQEVSEGEPLLDIYSPMLVAAQEELLLAARLARDVVSGTPEARRNADEMLTSARRRLEYWDIPVVDIERIERSGQPSRTITLRSSSRGVVVEKRVVSGQRIMAGETLYRLADPRILWVDAQVFEQDLALVRTGQHASVEIQSYPGERWHGSVTYVYPEVDAATRTARVRIELANRGQLRAGMFATVHLAGVRRRGVLSVPRSAVLATGRRSIVFVRSAGGTLEPREVVTGAATDDRVEIVSGLANGDTVVASATFLVDAESNLRSALGGMTGMPGMDAGVIPPPDGRPGPAGASDAPAKAPVDHSAHDMTGTGATRRDSLGRRG